MKLTIKENNSGTNDPCARCGKLTDAQIPYAIFPVNSLQPVCEQCTLRIEPLLLNLLEDLYMDSLHDDIKIDLQAWLENRKWK